jgi:integrase
LASLGAVFKAAVKEWHWLPDTPLKAVSKLTESSGRTRFLSDDELKRLLKACKESESPDLYLPVMLSITTGARQAEIMWLRWEQIDMKRQMIHLTKTKNKDSRTLPIVDEVLPLIEQRRKASGAIQLRGLVFPSRVSDNQPILLRMSWLGALKRAGIEDFRWHDLRHSAAPFLAMAGASLPEIGAVLGHRSAQTTQRYAHLAQEHTHNLVHKTMGKVLGGGDDE